MLRLMCLLGKGKMPLTLGVYAAGSRSDGNIHWSRRGRASCAGGAADGGRGDRL